MKHGSRQQLHYAWVPSAAIRAKKLVKLFEMLQQLQGKRHPVFVYGDGMVLKVDERYD